MELEEAVRKGNEKFNTMITEQLMAQEDIRRAAEVEAEVKIRSFQMARSGGGGGRQVVVT